MKDMNQQMSAITDQLLRGELTPEQKQANVRAYGDHGQYHVSHVGARSQAPYEGGCLAKQMDQMRKADGRHDAGLPMK